MPSTLCYNRHWFLTSCVLKSISIDFELDRNWKYSYCETTSRKKIQVVMEVWENFPYFFLRNRISNRPIGCNQETYIADDDNDNELFCGMVDQRKTFSLISNRDHCQRSSPSRIFDTPRAGFEPGQNLISGLVEWNCAVVIVTIVANHCYCCVRHVVFFYNESIALTYQ